MFTSTVTNERPRKVTQRTMIDALVGQDPFDAHSVRGRRDVDPRYGTTGKLPAVWAQTFRDVLGVHQFVVWSYATPIAWVTQHGEIVIPDVHYSTTTSKYQGKCRAWLRAR